MTIYPGDLVKIPQNSAFMNPALSTCVVIDASGFITAASGSFAWKFNEPGFVISNVCDGTFLLTPDHTGWYAAECVISELVKVMDYDDMPR